MHLWQELSKFALLGTDRSSLSPYLATQFSKHQIDTEQDAPTQLLEAAATFGAMKRAGYTLKTFSTSTLIAKNTENQAVCSPTSCRHLTAILRKAHEDSLREFLFHLHENNRVIAPEFLPDIFNQCMRSKSLWELIRPVAGARGKWLAQQNPDWQYLQDEVPAIDWETASAEAKAQLIQYWRHTDPAEALELLHFYWPTQDKSSKVRLLKTLETSLSLADEEFLETCLDDKRKEVRELAAKILVNIEGSELTDRMLARAKAALSLLISEDQQALKMSVELFDELDKSAIRDGLSLKMQWQKGGSAAGILFYVLTTIPLPYLVRHFKIEPQQLLESYIRSDWGVLLIQAAIESAARFEDEKWMSILLLFWAEGQYRNRWKAIDISSLIPKLSNDLFNKMALRLLQQNVNLFEEKNLLTQLLHSTQHDWEEALAKLFLRYLRQIAKDNTTTYWMAMQFRAIIKNAAYRCPPKQYDALLRILPEDQLKWTLWEEDYDRFLKILKFRRDMIVELEKMDS